MTSVQSHLQLLNGSKNHLNYFKYIILVFVFCFATDIVGQTKSDNIQTINGKKYYLHKLEKGQSLYSLTKLYQIKLDDIYSENPEVNEGTKAGQEIKIPFVSTTEKPNFNDSPKSNQVNIVVIDTGKYKTHKVAKGETVYSITKRYNLSNEYFEKLNPNAKAGLKEGQFVFIGEKEIKKTTVVSPSNTIHLTTTKDTINLNDPRFAKKSTYNIALILPFKLDETNDLVPGNLVKNNSSFPQIPTLAVDFYLGFKHAVDSLTSNDFKLNLDLYDLDDKDSANMVNLNNAVNTKGFDFIFGPMYASGFKTISQTAKEQKIPIVSPLTQQNKFLFDNIYTSKTNPSQYILLEALANYIIDSIKPKNAKVLINLASDKDAKEVNFVKAFKKYFNDKVIEKGFSVKDTVVTIRGLDGVKRNYAEGQKCVVVSLSLNQVLITDFTTQLAVYANKKDITLCGWESTANNDNLDQNYLNQLNYIFPCANNITNLKSYGSVVNKYQQQMGTYPGEYYFIGFDVAMYYLKNLKTFGKEFVFRLDELPFEGNYIRFKYARPDKSTGFDNNGVYIFKYNNFQIVATGWK